MSDRVDETIPGGRYLGPDGTYHDANGKPLDESPPEVKPEPEPIVEEKHSDDEGIWPAVEAPEVPIESKTLRKRSKKE